MVKDIKKILEQKFFSNSDEEKIATILTQHSYNLKRSNIVFHNGIISFKGISSSLRLNIMMKKEAIISSFNKEGIHVRDII